MFFYSTHIVVEGLSAVGAEGLLEVGITEEVTMAVEGLASVVRLAALAHTVDNEVIVGAVAVVSERLRAEVRLVVRWDGSWSRANGDLLASGRGSGQGNCCS